MCVTIEVIRSYFGIAATEDWTTAAALPGCKDMEKVSQHERINFTVITQASYYSWTSNLLHWQLVSGMLFPLKPK